MSSLCVNALKEWTRKESANIIYDSTVDEFTDQGLFDKVKGKPNVALVGFTADGDVFGGFYNIPVTEQKKSFIDPNIFVFSFESNGRCETPQRFVVKDFVRSYKSVGFDKNDRYGRFVDVGGGTGGLILGNEKSDSSCYNLSMSFEGIEDDTLTGNAYPGSFSCTRIVAVHLQ